jgi:glycosyltransferase involved in cell wall biosynthesis
MPVLSASPKLTVDIGPLFEDQWTGIPVFTRRLVQSLLRHGGVDVDFAYNLVRVPQPAVLAAIRMASGSFLRDEFERHAADDYDLIDPHQPVLFPSVKGRLCAGGREASTVHDLSTLYMPENHKDTNVAWHLDDMVAELASDEAVFCVSEATRTALLAAYPSAAAKARLLYQYADWPDTFAVLERNQPALRLGRYAVVIGTLEPRKNLKLLLDALALPELARSPMRFVVIGKQGWLIEPFLATLAPEQQERLIFSGFVSEYVKYRLIKGAAFMVYPSLYEGFGIPALEAMSLGKPVLAARTSSFPEIIGEGGVYFDPLSPGEFAAAFAEIDHPGRLAELAPLAEAQAGRFGWERMAAPVVAWAKG